MVEMNVGDIVITNRERATSPDGYTQWRVDGKSLRITRVFDTRVIARGALRHNGSEASVLLDKSEIVSVNGVRTDGKRNVGEKPADTPELSHIALDDPRIQWIFEDMGRYADEQGWCEQYDELAENFGITARGEVFSLFKDIPAEGTDSVNVAGDVRAQTQEEAERKLREYITRWAQTS